jgi:hypothetical protein
MKERREKKYRTGSLYDIYRKKKIYIYMMNTIIIGLTIPKYYLMNKITDDSIFKDKLLSSLLDIFRGNFLKVVIIKLLNKKTNY